MGSDNIAYIQLPVIDFSVLNSKNPDRSIYDSVRTKVLEALQEYGCFHASIAGVSLELQESVYGAIKYLFDLPTETKSKNTSSQMFYGYIASSPQIPLYESMGIEEPYIPEQVQNFTNLMWTQGNPQVCDDFQMYAKELWELNLLTKKMVFESLNLEMFLNEHIALSSYVLKLMKYRAPEPNESNLGMHTHADAGIITILHQNEVEGLDILTKDDKWLKVKLSPNLFTVMVGETLNVWLNGRLHVPLHRVVLRENKTRFSMGLFDIPKAGNSLKAIEKMVDDEHPLLFKPYKYEEFLNFHITGGQGIENYAVKAFCGVSN